MSASSKKSLLLAVGLIAVGSGIGFLRANPKAAQVVAKTTKSILPKNTSEPEPYTGKESPLIDELLAPTPGENSDYSEPWFIGVDRNNDAEVKKVIIKETLNRRKDPPQPELARLQYLNVRIALREGNDDAVRGILTLMAKVYEGAPTSANTEARMELDKAFALILTEGLQIPNLLQTISTLIREANRNNYPISKVYTEARREYLRDTVHKLLTEAQEQKPGSTVDPEVLENLVKSVDDHRKALLPEFDYDKPDTFELEKIVEAEIQKGLPTRTLKIGNRVTTVVDYKKAHEQGIKTEDRAFLEYFLEKLRLINAERGMLNVVRKALNTIETQKSPAESTQYNGVLARDAGDRFIKFHQRDNYWHIYSVGEDLTDDEGSCKPFGAPNHPTDRPIFNPDGADFVIHLPPPTPTKPAPKA